MASAGDDEDGPQGEQVAEDATCYHCVIMKALGDMPGGLEDCVVMLADCLAEVLNHYSPAARTVILDQIIVPALRGEPGSIERKH